MNKIDGIDIGEAFRLAEAETLQDRQKQVVNAIRAVVTERWNTNLKAERVRADLKAAEQKIASLDEKITKLKAGDWSVLPEPKEPPKDGEGERPAKNDRGPA